MNLDFGKNKKVFMAGHTGFWVVGLLCGYIN